MRVVALLVLVSFLPGCGEEGDVRFVESGLPATATMAELSGEDAQVMCEAIVDGTLAALEPGLLCRHLAASRFPDQQICQDAALECQQNAWRVTPIVALIGDSICRSTRPVQGCDVTVGQLEACLDDAFLARQRKLQAATCGRPAPPDAEDPLALDLAGQPACAPLLACKRAQSEESEPF